MGKKKRFCSFLDSCFYYVNIWDNNLRYFDGCATAFHCQLECKKDGNCMAFTFAFAIGRCYLKTSAIGTKRADTNYISGPKICDRMIGIIIFHLFYVQFFIFSCVCFDHTIG